ncbi:uncharacterized protein with ParB-like and HNH nuclease domain [Arthrobacter sp. CAN_A2]|uniref:DUF262 domain-containing protein n=1 Tax=Arthrobacter sp. CAN_A2 TaxID=2787718 RepID=UPI0018EFF9BA
MKGSMVALYTLFASVDREIVIPVYQRNYDWQHVNCERLLADLTSVIKEDRPKHFFGSVVVNPETTWSLVVIDGQQRLTTISVLILALIRLVEDGSLKTSEADLATRLRKFLVKDDSSRETTVRLKPVKDDATAYARLFGSDKDFIASSNITSNYQYFLKNLPLHGLDADQLWKAVSRLEIMHLDLEKHDAPQQIFESLNSTGLALSEADKVRNLVLMDLTTTEQNRVYEDYWNRIEKNVDHATDEFLRWYLVTKTSTTPKLDDVYEAFKKFAAKQGTKGAELLEDVRDHSEHYRDIRNSTIGETIIDRRVKRLNILRADVVLPFLMPVIAELRAKTVTPEDVADVLRILESYLFRRIVCDVPTNTLNKLFAGMYREVRTVRGRDDSFAEVFAYSLLRRDGSARFPGDEEFRSEFEHRNMYRINRERRLYLFECLENGTSKDALDVATRLGDGEISIEHVMPQSLTAVWRDSLGENADEIHGEWLHRIANLTVTGYNSTYSNLPFPEKRDHPEGFAASPYRLNHGIRSKLNWGLAELRARSAELSAWALSYWALPETSFEPLKKQLPEMPLGEDTDFTNARAVAFNFNGVERAVSSWRDLTIQVIRLLDEVDHEAVFDAAGKSSLFTVGQSLPNSQVEIMPSLSMDMNNNTWTKTQQIRAMFKAVGTSPDDLILYFPADEPPEAATPAPAVTDDEKLYPFSDLSAFIDVFEERSGQRRTPEDNIQLIDQFLAALAPHRRSDYLEQLGMNAFQFSANSERLDAATLSQLLALISAKAVEQESFNPQAVHMAIMDGSLLDWLRRLDALAMSSV